LCHLFIVIREGYKLNEELSRELEKCMVKDSNDFTIPLIDSEKFKQVDFASGIKKFNEICAQMFLEVDISVAEKGSIATDWDIIKGMYFT
jgi:predicted lactoylglutathione lyase